MEEVTKAAKLFGLDPEFFVDTFMKPKLKVFKHNVSFGIAKLYTLFHSAHPILTLPTLAYVHPILTLPIPF